MKLLWQKSRLKTDDDIMQMNRETVCLDAERIVNRLFSFAITGVFSRIPELPVSDVRRSCPVAVSQ